MFDMLVKLYDLPPLEAELARQTAAGVTIRHPMALERDFVVNWVGQNFYPEWIAETKVAFSRQPISCFIAVDNGQLVGFACYDTTYRNFFGPTGVTESQRGRGVGKVLLLACLHAMVAQGYAYAIIGGVGPAEFYAKAVGAVKIEGSDPGVYGGMLSR